MAPIVIGMSVFAPIFGGPQEMANGGRVFLRNTCYIGIIQIVIALLLILKYMDNLPLPKQSPKSMLSIFGNKHTWIMTWIYTCGFGSFIGYSVALALLVHKEFPEISFTYAAFIDPFVSALSRSFGGWWADKINSGSKITFFPLLVLFFSSAGISAKVYLDCDGRKIGS